MADVGVRRSRAVGTGWVWIWDGMNIMHGPLFKLLDTVYRVTYAARRFKMSLGS